MTGLTHTKEVKQSIIRNCQQRSANNICCYKITTATCILTPAHFGIEGILRHYFSHGTIITIIMELKQQRRCCCSDVFVAMSTQMSLKK